MGIWLGGVVKFRPRFMRIADSMLLGLGTRDGGVHTIHCECHHVHYEYELSSKGGPVQHNSCFEHFVTTRERRWQMPGMKKQFCSFASLDLP